MTILTQIDNFTWQQFAIFFILVFGIVGIFLKVFLWFIDSKPNQHGFVDPILFMFGAAFMAGMALFYVEVPPKKDPECRTTIIRQYLDNDEKEEFEIPPKKHVKKPKKQIKPCGVTQ